MSWVVELPPRAPASVLRELGALVAEWPGEDLLSVNVGPMKLRVRLRDCEETRQQVGEIVRAASEAAELF